MDDQNFASVPEILSPAPPEKDNRITEQLKWFPILPDDSLTDRKVASVLLDCSLSTIRRLEKSGQLEPVVKLGPNMPRLRVGSLRKLMNGGVA